MRSCEIVKRISEKYVDMLPGMWFAGGSEDAEMKLALPMPLLNRRIFVPGGWFFYQPQTNWPPDPNSFFAGMTFDQAVAKIIEHRKANPRFNLTVDPEEVAAELDLFTCFRLNFDPNFCRGGIGDAVLKKAPPSPLSLTEASGPKSASVVEGVKRVAIGIGVLLEFLGSGGKAVDPELSRKRSWVCAHGGPVETACPHNQPKDILSVFTVPAANLLHRQLELKNKMKLETPDDAALGICGVCSCVLSLKVHVPLKHVTKHMSADLLEQFPDFCWIKKERTP